MIPWLAEMKQYGLEVQAHNEQTKRVQAHAAAIQACIPAGQLLALIAIAEAAQASLKLYDGDAHAVIHEAVDAAEGVE